MVAVGFFFFIAQRDSRTLKAGDVVTGEVIGLVQPQDWDFFDAGRLVVRYTIHGETHTRRIWLDNELSDYHVGQHVNVYVRGGDIRTDREANDPAPWGVTAVVLGLAGLGTTGRGFALRRAPRQWTVAESGDRRVLPLASWRLAPRKAAVEIVGGDLRLFVPSFFGSHRMVAPLQEVGVHVVPSARDAGMDESEVWFADGLHFLDLPTKWAMSPPNLVLVFARPVRVPPIRWLLLLNNPLPVGWRASRSPQGEHADAVLLRCPAPRACAEQLVLAGAQRVDEPLAWFQRHRTTVHDAERIAELRQADDRLKHAARVANAGWLVASVFAVVARASGDARFLVPAGVAGVAAFLLPRLVARRTAPHDK